VYNAVAEPRRRQVLDVLARGERSAGDLVVALDLARPQVSKHPKVLHEVGLVAVRENHIRSGMEGGMQTSLDALEEVAVALRRIMVPQRDSAPGSRAPGSHDALSDRSNSHHGSKVRVGQRASRAVSFSRTGP
jgi:DNA-binding transcriptional ArsR family regulator